MAKTYGKMKDESFRQKATEFYVKIQVVGTPDDCLQQLAELRRLTGLDHLVTEFSFGGMPHEEAEVNMRLFADRVMPVLQRDRAFAAPAPASADAPAEAARPESSRRPDFRPAGPRPPSDHPDPAGAPRVVPDPGSASPRARADTGRGWESRARAPAKPRVTGQLDALTMVPEEVHRRQVQRVERPDRRREGVQRRASTSGLSSTTMIPSRRSRTLSPCDRSSRARVPGSRPRTAGAGSPSADSCQSSSGGVRFPPGWREPPKRRDPSPVGPVVIQLAHDRLKLATGARRTLQGPGRRGHPALADQLGRTASEASDCVPRAGNKLGHHPIAVRHEDGLAAWARRTYSLSLF